ncbi:MAG: delta-lactam-biosynthetic de-N-acetylase [Clostridia bacterium]|nr:delta-lactam-biosynthetic de-N-acetylase [Clostridia bacterium]
MIKNKYKINITIMLALIISIFSISVISMNGENLVSTSIDINENTKIGWGIKRNDNHEQPDVGETNKKILEENGGICLGDKQKKYIYLTFDEGYEAGYTEKILNILKENEVDATFFITGHYLNTQSDLVKRMLEEGHLVGNHTINHKSMPELSDEEIKKEVMGLHQALYDKFAYEMLFLRPPMGEYSERSLKVTNQLGYKTVMWSFAYEDWDESNQPNKEQSTEKILSNIHNGEIMLLHANSKTNTEILDNVIKEIKQMGYEFKNLDSFE